MMLPKIWRGLKRVGDWLRRKFGGDPDGAWPDTGGLYPNDGNFEEWGIATDDKEVNAIAEELADKAIKEFNNLEGEISYPAMIVYAVMMGCAQAFVTPARDGLLNEIAGDQIQTID